MTHTPETIHAAFDLWQAADAAARDEGADEDSRDAAMHRAAEIERQAVALPVETVGDLMILIRMVLEPGDSLRATGRLLVTRAHAEAAPV